MNPNRTVVIVSGGDAVSPFTTTTQGCGRGLSAGNTDTALREALIEVGMTVFTAPAMNSRTAVQEPDPDDFGAFGDCPPATSRPHDHHLHRRHRQRR